MLRSSNHLTIIHEHSCDIADSTHMRIVCRTTEIPSHSRIRIRRTRGVALHHRLRLSLDIPGVLLTRPQTSVVFLRLEDRSLALGSEQKKSEVLRSVVRGKSCLSCHQAISYLVDSLSVIAAENLRMRQNIKYNVLKLVRRT